MNTDDNQLCRESLDYLCDNDCTLLSLYNIIIYSVSVSKRMAEGKLVYYPCSQLFWAMWKFSA